MTVQLVASVFAAAGVLPWLAVVGLVIRRLSHIALATTYVLAVLVAVLHRKPERRRAAHDMLDWHPFSRRR
ncbi:hypothetical protein OG216_08870 [Streptomycetaceae bacterium NBC_01309]